MGDQYPKLEIYADRAVLHSAPDRVREFTEGCTDTSARARLSALRTKLEAGFLTELIKECSQPNAPLQDLAEPGATALRALVDSVTSELGRALVGLTVLQLTIKCIAPDQCIRLHKGSARQGSFSWTEGMPMRVIDKSYVTPALRRANILKVNSDGVFMTRTLAENYPYSPVYKAAIRGAREPWSVVVELVEHGELDPLAALRNMIIYLQNRSDQFNSASAEMLAATHSAAEKVVHLRDAIDFMLAFVNSSPHSARLFEVAMHSLLQVIEDGGGLDGSLKPLAQMRSANLKHGNIGDIEIVERPQSMRIVEAWDAKYGKRYLYEELDELSTKLAEHPEARRVGFVVEQCPDLRSDVTTRRDEIISLRGVDIQLLSFSDWAELLFDEYDLDPAESSHAWVLAFAECLAQQRRDRAPIDEPCDAWVALLKEFAAQWRP